MFLALRELWFARTRFALMGAVIGLIAVLMVMLSGLASGLVHDGVSGLQQTPVQAFAFEQGTKIDSAFSRSVVTEEQRDDWRARPDVAKAELLGTMIVNARTQEGTAVDLTLFGVEKGSFLEPHADQGSALAADHDIVVSESARDEGVRLGDTVTIDRVGTELTVVGFTGEQRTFGHVDVAYVPLATWQEIHAGSAAGDDPAPQVYTEASVVAVQGLDGAVPDLTAGDAAAGTTSKTLSESFDASPGYTAELMTMSLIQAFLYAIAALVVGAFFTLWTVQRTRELAVMRAMGASTRFLMGDGLMQAIIVLTLSVTVGAGLGVGFGALLLGTGMPFALVPGPILGGAALLVVLGLVGAAFATVRITAVDPLTALGENR